VKKVAAVVKVANAAASGKAHKLTVVKEKPADDARRVEWLVEACALSREALDKASTKKRKVRRSVEKRECTPIPACTHSPHARTSRMHVHPACIHTPHACIPTLIHQPLRST
jgi:hypothetical protein